MDTIEQQRKVSEFVGREVHYCASFLISELSASDKYMDEIMEFSTSYPSFGNEGKGRGECDQCSKIVVVDDYYKTCEDCYEPDPIEALEHWIVSDWLADKLQDKGEMITKDFFGLTIWGRTTSGQAIMMDGVINEIYEELHK